jgi:hypothetical protein
LPQQAADPIHRLAAARVPVSTGKRRPGVCRVSMEGHQMTDFWQGAILGLLFVAFGIASYFRCKAYVEWLKK